METSLMLPPENQVALDHKIEIYQGASLLKIDDKEQAALHAGFDRALIEIRPDGLIYLPQVFWRGRLNQTFGIGQWCLVPKSQIKDPDHNKLYIEGVLMVRGHYVATAVGEAEYHESNSNQSWASVWESAKSDCITRCCKDLGIASELWQPEFIRKWIDEFAVKVFVTDKSGKRKPQWRKKTAAPFWNEVQPGQQNNQQPAQQPQPKQANTNQGNTAYNHKPMGTAAKPQISNENFKKLCDRLRAGELAVFDQAQQHFSMDQAQMSVFKGIRDNVVKQQATQATPVEQPAEGDASMTRVIAVWSAKVDKCNTLEQLAELYKKNQPTIDAHDVIKHLFTARKIELQKQ